MKKELIVKYSRWALVVVGMCLLAAVYAWPRIGIAPDRYSWPDEMANYFFARQFAAEQTLVVDEPYNAIAQNLITPRSVTIRQGNLIPVGFVGLPVLYGLLMMMLGDLAVFATAVLGVLGVVLVYQLTALFFNRTVAGVAAILIALQPAYAYYASFAMLPNMAFLACALGGIYFLLRSSYHRAIFYNFTLSSLLLGCAVMIRPSEILWLGPVVLGIAIALRKVFTLMRLLHWILPAAVVGFVNAYLNFATYGSLLPLGYTTTVSQTGSVTQGVSLTGALLPFGVDAAQLWENVTRFIMPAHWYFLVLAVFGIVSYAFFHQYREKYAYFAVLAWVSIVLLVYYGSWELVDSFTLNHSVLGISFNRYWLPIIILLTPLIAYFVVHVYRLGTIWHKMAAVGIVFAVLVMNLMQLYVLRPDNLVAVKQSLREQQELHEHIIDTTQGNAVIITERGDKIVFPQRAVISQFDPAHLSGIELLLTADIPVYYLIFQDALLIERLNVRSFMPQGLRITNPRVLPHDYYLYDVTLE